jgi:hypothetical protein
VEPTLRNACQRAAADGKARDHFETTRPAYDGAAAQG